MTSQVRLEEPAALRPLPDLPTGEPGSTDTPAPARPRPAPPARPQPRPAPADETVRRSMTVTIPLPSSLAFRRVLVTLGVVASLVGGIAAVQVAAALTAASAPPSAPPVSIQQLTDQLRAEEARSTDLQSQLDQLSGLSKQLSTSLSAAQAQVTTDGQTATGLRTKLATAQAQLANVQAQLAASQARLAQLNAAAQAATLPRAASSRATAAGGGRPVGRPTAPPATSPATPAPTPGSTPPPTPEPTGGDR